MKYEIKSKPNHGAILVYMLIDRILACIVPARNQGNFLQKSSFREQRGATRAFVDGHPGSAPRLDEVKEQNGCEGDDEGAEDQGNRLSGERIGESVFEKIDSPTKESHDYEGGKAPESAGEPSSKSQRWGWAQGSGKVPNSGVHGSVLVRTPGREYGLREAQKV